MIRPRTFDADLDFPIALDEGGIHGRKQKKVGERLPTQAIVVPDIFTRPQKRLLATNDCKKGIRDNDIASRDMSRELVETPWTCVHVTQSRECEQFAVLKNELAKPYKWRQDFNTLSIVPEHATLGSLPLFMKEWSTISADMATCTNIEVAEEGEKNTVFGGNMLLVNKYAPLNSQEMVQANDDSVQRIRKWFGSWSKCLKETSTFDQMEAVQRSSDSDFEEEYEDRGRSLENSLSSRAILITGPVGIGKTALVYALAKEFGLNVIELSPSDHRSGPKITECISEATTSTNLGRKHSQCADGSGATIVLIESIDVCLDCDKGMLSSITDIILSSRRPIVLTAESGSQSPYLSSISGLLQQGTIAHVRLAAPTVNEVKTVLDRIVEEENKVAAMNDATKSHIEETISQLVHDVNGDIRMAINILQFQGYLARPCSHLVQEPPASTISTKLSPLRSFRKNNVMEDDLRIMSKEAVNIMASLLGISQWKSNEDGALDGWRTKCASLQDIDKICWDLENESTRDKIKNFKSKWWSFPGQFSMYPTCDHFNNLECESFLEIMADIDAHKIKASSGEGRRAQNLAERSRHLRWIKCDTLTQLQTHKRIAYTMMRERDIES